VIEAFVGFEDRVTIGGRTSLLLTCGRQVRQTVGRRYHIITVNSVNKLQDLANRRDRFSWKFSLIIITHKTKIMPVDGIICSVTVENTKIEQVDEFSYLGSLFTADADCTGEIRPSREKVKETMQFR